MTIRATASFRVTENELDTALDAIRTFVEHTRSEPGTLRYESWRSIDRSTEFLHVMEFADEAAEQAHGSSDAVRAFTDALYPTSEEPPAFGRWRASHAARLAPHQRDTLILHREDDA